MDVLKLAEIATIQTGLVIGRKKDKFNNASEFKYKKINLRSFGENGHLILNTLEDLNSVSEIHENFFTQLNDIVVRLFTPINPIIIDKRSKGFLVPSQAAIIRLKKDVILPEYLRYFLSLPEATDRMLAGEGGSTQRAIRISAFSNLDIPIPPVKLQLSIARLIDIENQRNALYNKLMEEENKLILLKVRDIIGGNKK